MIDNARGRILVVDDEDSIRFSVEAILGEDFDVVGVSNVPDAVTRLTGGGIDVVLTDYDMPGMSGMDLLRMIADRFPDVLPIVLTGHAAIPELVAAEKARLSVRVISKPYDPARLVKWVETTVRLARMKQATNRLQSRLRPRPSPSGAP